MFPVEGYFIAFFKAFKLYLHTLVEYCSSVWSPSNTDLITKLESVQRRFNKSLSGMSSFSYSDHLCLVNVDSLEMHRLRANLMLCFKILKGFVDVDPLNFLNVLLSTLSLVAIATS